MKNLLFVLCLSTLLSCEQNQVDKVVSSPTPDEVVISAPTVQNGVLSFVAYSDFDAYLTKVNNMNSQSYAEWTKALNFKSLYSIYVNTLQQDDAPIKLNSINPSFAKLSDERGVVFIGEYTYSFSSSETKIIRGKSGTNVATLLNTKDKATYDKLGIASAKVEKLIGSSPNARPIPFVLNQTGPSTAARTYAKATIEFVKYGTLVVVPGPPTCSGGICLGPYATTQQSTGTMTVQYYKSPVIGSDYQMTPERFDFSWSFDVNGVNQQGAVSESGVPTLTKVFYQGTMGTFFGPIGPANENITNFTATVTAFDYIYSNGGAGELKDSKILFTFSD